MLQIITGVILAMHYVAHVEQAWLSIAHIMRDVWGGWLIRYMHVNGASFFFIVLYLHVARSLYFRAYNRNKAAWLSGVVILFLVILVAFIGYVLP